MTVVESALGDGPAADPSRKGTYDELAQALDSRRGLARRTADVVVAALCAYAISLTILGLAEAIGGASITTNFQRSQDTLYSLAKDTGGKAMLDYNDLSMGIVQAEQAVTSCSASPSSMSASSAG